MKRAAAAVLLIFSLLAASCGENPAPVSEQPASSFAASQTSGANASSASSGASSALSSSAVSSRRASSAAASAVRSGGRNASSVSASADESGLPAHFRSRSASVMTEVAKTVSQTLTLRKIHLTPEDDRNLVLKLPENWTVRASGNDFIILAGKTVVGYLQAWMSAVPEQLDLVSSSELSDDGRISAYSMDYRFESGGAPRAANIYRVVLTEGFRSAILDIRRDALDEQLFQRIFSTLVFLSPQRDSGAGTVDYSAKAADIMILGNSFVASSQVGTILGYMADSGGKSLNAYAQSRGYATVETYSGDPQILSQVASGTYEVVFQCGFYGSNAAAFRTLLDAGHPNTKFVVFPAHNESSEEPYSNFAAGGCGLADWKGLVDLLIAWGIDKSRLCIADEHKHSSPLAGFAGACLIYGYLYKSMPPLGENEKGIYASLIPEQSVNRRQFYEELELIRRTAYDFLYS